MAVIQNDGTIALDRGDLFKAPLFINAGDDDEPVRYNMKEHPDTLVYFSIMRPNQTFELGVIRKIFTSKDSNEYGDVMIFLKSRETLVLTPGRYYYQVKVKLDDGKINTVTDRETMYVR